MLRWMLAAVLGGGLVMAGRVVAEEGPVERREETPVGVPRGADATPLAVPAGCGVEKTVCGKDVVLREHQSATTLPDFVVREVVVEKGKRTTVEVGYLESRQFRTELVLKPRETTEQVTCMTVQPATTVDPCTGCASTCYQQVPVVKTVKITVLDVVPEQREVIVKTPYLKPVEENVVVKRLAVDSVTVPAVRKTLEAIVVPYEVKVQKPLDTIPCHP